jgi:hypothetical protein
MNIQAGTRGDDGWLAFGLNSTEGPVGLVRSLRVRVNDTVASYQLFIRLPRSSGPDEGPAFFLETDCFSLDGSGASWLAMTLVCAGRTRASFPVQAVQSGTQLALGTTNPDEVADAIHAFGASHDVQIIVSGPDGLILTFPVPADPYFLTTHMRLATARNRMACALI